MVAQFSTIFMIVRWFIVALGYKKSALYMCNGVVFIIAFFLCRILLLPVMFYIYVTQYGLCWEAGLDSVPLVLVAVSAVNFPILWGLNLVWFRVLVLGALKALNSKNLSSKKE